MNSVSVLYMLHPPLNFSPSYIGYFFGEMNALKALGAWGINFLVMKKLQDRDSTLIFISCICYSLMAVSLTFATELWHIFLGEYFCLYYFNCHPRYYSEKNWFKLVFLHGFSPIFQKYY